MVAREPFQRNSDKRKSQLTHQKSGQEFGSHMDLRLKKSSIAAWAPEELVRHWERWETELANSKEPVGQQNNLDYAAMSVGFKSWADGLRFIHIHSDMLYRLISWPEMREFWAWFLLDPDASPTDIYKVAYRSISGWHIRTPVQRSERQKLLEETRQLANRLAVNLQRLKGAGDLIDWHDLSLEVVHRGGDARSEIEAAIRYLIIGAPAQYHNDAHLPKLPVALKSISDWSQKQINKGRTSLVRKVNASSARRTYFVAQMISAFARRPAGLDLSKIACFCRCALDDDGVNEDTVRKNQRYQRLFDIYIRGKDPLLQLGNTPEEIVKAVLGDELFRKFMAGKS